MSYLLFLDDTRIERQQISCLGGLLLRTEEYASLREQLRSLKRQYLSDEHAPVKWSPSKTDPLLQPQRALGEQRPLRKAVCDLIGSMDGLLMFGCIDEQAQAYDDSKRQRYLLQGLEYLCQRAQMHLDGIADTAQVISDLPGTGLDGPLSRRFLKLHRDGSGAPFFDIRLTRLDRTLLFSHACGCEGIQLADFAVGALCQAVKGKGTYYLECFRDRVRREAASSRIKGYGIVVHPSNSTIMDGACIYCAGGGWPE